MDARHAEFSMIGRDQHHHANFNIFNFHHQINYFLDGTNNGRAVRTWTYREHIFTEKHTGNHWCSCVKSQRILDLWRYGSHWSNSHSPPLLHSLIKNPSPSVFSSLCYWLALIISLTPVVFPLYKCNTTTYIWNLSPQLQPFLNLWWIIAVNVESMCPHAKTGLSVPKIKGVQE